MITKLSLYTSNRFNKKGMGLLMASCILTSAFIYAQDKTNVVKTSVKPGDMKTYTVKEDGSINLLFSRKGKKHELYFNYGYDKDLNLVTETEEELDIEKAKKNFSQSGIIGINYESSGIIRDSVLSVENNKLGQLVLMTG